MELDHQQMAGASFEKPITAAVPGIRGDSSEVTAWELHLFKSRHARLHPFGSFIWFSLFVSNSLLTSEAAPRSSICCRSRQAGRRGEERARRWSCKRWLHGNWQHLALRGSGSASRHHNACEKAQKQVQIHCKTQGSLRRRAFNKQMKGEAIYCRTWGSCSGIKSL